MKERYKWREIRPDDLGTRFVRIEGPAKLLENPLFGFGIETPVTRFFLERLESNFPIIVPDRNFRLFVLYWFGKKEGVDVLARMFTLEELGKKEAGVVKDDQEITRERVRQIIDRTIRQLHSNSPDYLKHRFPLGLLLDHIDRPPFMADKKGTSRKIAMAVLQGVNYEGLKKEGFSAERLADSRILLSKYGLPVPYARESYQKLIDDLRSVSADDTKEVKQQFLDRISISFFSRHRAELKSCCLALSDLAREAGLHLTGRKGEFGLILQSLSEAGIAWRPLSYEIKSGKWKGLLQNYYIILAVDKKEALTVLQSDQGLKPLRREVVRQIFGEKADRLPTTTELKYRKYRDKYRSIGSLLIELGQRSGGTGFDTLKVLKDCPVPIFTTISGGYFYPFNRKLEMLKFLRSR